MGAYILRRLLYAIPVLLGTIFVLFICFNVVPGDPALVRAGKHATPEVLASIRAEMGLDRSLPLQFVKLIKDTLTFDFGRSWSTQEKITDMIWNGMGPSLSLVIPPFVISSVLGILLGLLLAIYRGTLVDRTIVGLSVAAQSVSILVYILYGQYFMAFQWRFFPISGYDPDWINRWHYLILPGLIYIALSLAPSIRFYRTVFLDEIYQDYVRTAQSKGLGLRAVMLRHVLKNAMIPIITDLVIQLPLLILGALLLESFFGIPGLGDLTVRAIANTDRPVIMGITIVGTIGYIFFNLVSDVLYALVDPRVQLK